MLLISQLFIHAPNTLLVRAVKMTAVTSASELIITAPQTVAFVAPMPQNGFDAFNGQREAEANEDEAEELLYN